MHCSDCNGTTAPGWQVEEKEPPKKTKKEPIEVTVQADATSDTYNLATLFRFSPLLRLFSANIYFLHR